MRRRRHPFSNLGYASSEERGVNALLIVGGLLALGVAGIVMGQKPKA